MIVGKESAGKTCLLRRLLKEDISDVTSTDGVDIVVRRCKINIEDGKWTIGKGINDDKVGRIKRALIPNTEDRNTQNMQVDETNNMNTRQGDEKSTNNKDITTNTKVRLENSNDTNESSSLFMSEDSTNKAIVNLDNKEVTNGSSSLVMPEDFTIDDKVNLDNKEVTNESSSLVMPEDFTTDDKVNLDNKQNESSLLVMPEDLMSHVFSKSTVNAPLNLYALCELWDFAGQKEFYATHQAFLTSSAVYLVVADMKDDISKQGLGQCFADFQNIGEYVDFWFDSIHCHRTADKQARNGHFDPPIVLVFTGKDRYELEADLKKRKKELNDQLDQVLGLQSKYHHLHKKCYLSNLTDTDEEFVKLQHVISETARKMDNWGNTFPLKWILLEHLIDINKNEGKNIINLNDMSKLAEHHDISILEKDELLLFLRFQHTVGNIIFFENIPDLIILKPQWLADAFRCLVSDRIDDSGLHHLEDWTLFRRQGKLSESLITELFKSKDGSQFSGQKNNLHKVMEKLDILVKIENSSYYIMPSQMPSSKFEDVCRNVGILTKNCKRTSWLCYKFEFLPPSFFNHISAWFIKQYIPSKVDSDATSFALYRGICVFDIDISGCEKNTSYHVD
ncbi:probable serine/threonine-protein kinase roco6 [Mytilus trossulus]|uniref:probable serine/threonine-protein kinase roco6 n=1 Tax=Mytilus trossulus TaxID=6551 RepID=UPI0030070E48